MFEHHLHVSPDLEHHPPIFLLGSKTPNAKSGSIDSALRCLFSTRLISQLRLAEDQPAEGYIYCILQTNSFPWAFPPRVHLSLQTCNFIWKIHPQVSVSQKPCMCVQAEAWHSRVLGSCRLSGLLSSLARASKAALHLMSSCQFFRPLYLVLRFSWQTAEGAVCCWISSDGWPLPSLQHLASSSRSACSLRKISSTAASLIYSHWLCLLSAQAHTSTTLTFIKTDLLQNIKLLHKSAVRRFYLILLKHFMVLYHHRVEDGRTAAGEGYKGIWYLACYSNDPQAILALLRCGWVI